jgi:hypothetical protein
LHRTLTVATRLRTAMHSVGIFTLEDLAEESGIELSVIEALDAGDLGRVDVLTTLKLKESLGSFSIRWICLGQGDPDELTYRLNHREAQIIDSFRELTESGQTRVERTIDRHKPK